MRILLILPILLSSFAFGDTTGQNALWNCTINANLRGDSYHFFHWGQDSWKGRALMICKNDVGRVERREVEINFNGALSGYGVNETSVIGLKTEIVTSNVPSNFEVYAYVFNRKAPAIIWRSESGGILVEANVISEDIPEIQASLQQGNLYIR
jgi:hypothetical protein